MCLLTKLWYCKFWQGKLSLSSRYSFCNLKDMINQQLPEIISHVWSNKCRKFYMRKALVLRSGKLQFQETFLDCCFQSCSFLDDLTKNILKTCENKQSSMRARLSYCEVMVGLLIQLKVEVKVILDTINILRNTHYLPYHKWKIRP